MFLLCSNIIAVLINSDNLEKFQQWIYVYSIFGQRLNQTLIKGEQFRIKLILINSQQMHKKQSEKDKSKVLLQKQQKEHQNQRRQINPSILWQQLSSFRKDPSIINRLLQNKKSYFNKNNFLFSPYHPYKSIKTLQGRQPVNLLLGQIYNDRNLLPITFNGQLSKAASELANSFKSCHLNNTSFDIKSLSKQIKDKLSLNKKFTFDNPITCLVGVGFNDQFEPLLSLLVGDGDPEKKNRKNILSNQFKFGGVGCTLLADSLICAVYLFTSNMTQI